MLQGGCNIASYFISLEEKFPAITDTQSKEQAPSNIFLIFFLNIDIQIPEKSPGRYMRRSRDTTKRPQAFLEPLEGFTEQEREKQQE